MGAGLLAGRSCVVAGGAGAVGRAFTAVLLGAGARVCVVDTTAGESGERLRYERDDITDLGPRVRAEIGQADLVLLAVPETVAMRAADQLLVCLRPGGLLADTLSVKSDFVSKVAGSRHDVQIVSLNPMFAPSLGFAGRPVAGVTVQDGDLARLLLRVVEDQGARVVPMTADEHDRLCAVTQTLTHAAILAFGGAMRRLDADVARLGAVAPPPHLTLLGLLARVAGGAPRTYWDIQAGNPHAPAARRALADSLREIAEIVDGGDEAAFDSAVEEIRGFLGPDFESYRELCARNFAQLRESSPEARR